MIWKVWISFVQSELIIFLQALGIYLKIKYEEKSEIILEEIKSTMNILRSITELCLQNQLDTLAKMGIVYTIDSLQCRPDLINF